MLDSCSTRIPPNGVRSFHYGGNNNDFFQPLEKIILPIRARADESTKHLQRHWSSPPREQYYALFSGEGTPSIRIEPFLSRIRGCFNGLRRILAHFIN